jgi:dTDP-4-dehydrorhamnose 3,5-epimerase
MTPFLYSAKVSEPKLTKAGCILINNERVIGEHGSSQELYRMSKFSSAYRKVYLHESRFFFMQDDLITADKDVVRGMRVQLLYEQAKLIYVLRGRVTCVVIDARRDSKIFGQMEMFDLVQDGLMVFVPNHFLVGYWFRENGTLLFCKNSNEYFPNAEVGVSPLDNALPFPWKDKDVVFSPKDRALPFFQEFSNQLEKK